MSNKINIDIVSDVVCPWCIIGYKNLQAAILALDITDKVDLQWQPFELNPNMPAEGQNLREHVAEKYGSSAAESEQARINIRERGRQVGFTFNFYENMRIVNTRDAHILLEYAHQFGKQTELKLRLFSATFTDKKNVSDRDVLLNEIEQLGLDVEQAALRLQGSEYRDAVIEQEVYWQNLGISAVPAVVFNRKSAVSGAQSIDTYKDMLRELLAS